jgi:hypothetical protein
MQPGEEDAVTAPGAVRDHPAGRELLRKRGDDEIRRDAEQFGGKRHELVGRSPQWPSSSASASACETPALTRIGAVGSMPSRVAMVSAVRKPMPRMSRARR